jgi:ribosome assembly protein YihI (activator of Der GTPase)
MAIRVQVGTPSGVQASIHKDNPINTELKKVEVSLVNLEKLKNVDTLTNGLENGYTLIYNSNTQTWVTQTFNNIVGNIDGGTY